MVGKAIAADSLSRASRVGAIAAFLEIHFFFTFHDRPPSFSLPPGSFEKAFSHKKGGV
jgi:hypothetical protein